MVGDGGGNVLASEALRTLSLVLMEEACESAGEGSGGATSVVGVTGIRIFIFGRDSSVGLKMSSANLIIQSRT